MLAKDVQLWFLDEFRSTRPAPAQGSRAGGQRSGAEFAADHWLRTYLRTSVERYKTIPLPLRGARLAQALPSDQLFVETRLWSRTSAAEGGLSSWDVLIEKGRKAVTGEAGSGKSTLLRFIALRLAEAGLLAIESGDARAADAPAASVETRVPARLALFVDLAGAWEALADLPQGQARADGWLEFLGGKLRASKTDVMEWFARGKIVLLFDGLDEVPDARVRTELVSRIYELHLAFDTGNTVVLSCRDAAWGTEMEHGQFDQFHIPHMNRAETDRYLARFCGAAFHTEAEIVKERLAECFRTSQSIAELASNPQMASMLAILAVDGPVPKEQARLLDKLAAKLIGTIPDARKQLMTLAAHMQMAKDNAGVPTCSLRVQEAGALLSRSSGADGFEASPREAADLGERVVHDLAVKTGMLQIDGEASQNRLVHFRHPAFQQYLAACYFTENDVNLQVLLEHATDPHWSKTLAFTAELLSLASGSSAKVKDFLEKVLRTPDESSMRDIAVLAEWAARVAAVTACVTAIATLVPEADLAVVGEAHKRILPIFDDPHTALDIRIRIADGLGAIADPRLGHDRVSRWVAIPAGRFLRGSQADDAWSQEAPQVEVDLSEFWIQRWPVTVGEFREFVEDAGGYDESAYWSARGWEWRRATGHLAPDDWLLNRQRKNRPVTGVSWWEAEAYCTWLGLTSAQKQGVPPGRVIQLPTEAQWEKAARGGITATRRGDEVLAQRFPWGSEWKEDSAEEDPANCADTDKGLLPVGLFPRGHSRTFGLWDMAGNVAERCRDSFAEYPRDQPPLDPVVVRETGDQVIRGGAFDSSPLNLRVSCRFGTARESRSRRIGFRCAAS